MHLKGENFIIDAVQHHFQLHHVIGTHGMRICMLLQGW
jgi:hypothetical protein